MDVGIFPFFQGALFKKFSVTGIPKLIILDGNDGKLLNKDGFFIPSEDPTGEDFPWRSKEFLEIVCNVNFVNKNGATKSWEDIASQNDIVGLYFSGHVGNYFTVYDLENICNAMPLWIDFSVAMNCGLI